ncbi:hypothetical protein T265_12207 [Opisthorchis viverrini]|uniref:Uncharacterized protein n=1 Tax=Opisthorchis viverrini TaxID=6198 RepID=A0A074YZL1_OPIVI|nr:hypothetical protein T265_12207 [Opisthorchis viverrini]KER18642.1 hypothetical protein T265_12207 [Opisthorchis viverrini]
MVNRAWFRAARHPELYRRLCQLPEWSPPLLDRQLFPFGCAVDTEAAPSTGQSSDSIASLLINSGNASVDWFGIFQKRSRLRRNWLLGRHRMRRFTGHNEGNGVGLFCPVSQCTKSQAWIDSYVSQHTLVCHPG